MEIKTSGKTNDEEIIYEFISGLDIFYEGWIFSRIVESLWWQSLTPHMQSSAAKSVGMRAAPGSVKSNWKGMATDEIDQVDVSMEIWKRAFKNACERLCPIRRGGHECGCLPVLAKLEDEQREDGVYLNDVERPDILIKVFHLLNALIDLMMLPKDMPLDKSMRKEVCPVFSGSLIKRVLYDFLPDEFCPDPVPDSLMDSLDSENSSDEGGEFVNHCPLKASSPLYHPPLAASIMVITGDSSGKSELRCSSSSLIDKAHTSNNELSKINSPWSSILSSVSFSPMVSSAAEPALLTTNR